MQRCMTYSRAGSWSRVTQWMHSTRHASMKPCAQFVRVMVGYPTPEPGSGSGAASREVPAVSDGTAAACWAPARCSCAVAKCRSNRWHTCHLASIARPGGRGGRTWILGSESTHCANTRLRPYSGSMRKVADAHQTHCLQPMQLTSSTNTARRSAGSAALPSTWPTSHLLSGSPAQGGALHACSLCRGGLEE